MKTAIVAAVLCLAQAGCQCMFGEGGWETRGTPPPDYDVAMQVIFSRAPCQRPSIYCGSVTWVGGPSLTCDGLTGRTGCATYSGHEVEVVYGEVVYVTALAHEMGHIFWHECFGAEGHPREHERWTDETNLAIERAVGSWQQ